MHTGFLSATCLVLAVTCSACWLEPRGERPGFGISGELTTETVTDWSFTDDIEEIVIETRTWYRLPHSVTIWCVSIDGDKRDPNVRLRIAGKIYERRLEPITDPERTGSIDRAFGEKYHYDVNEDPEITAYWRVIDRT
jgi:hypothetical protein